MISRSSLDRDDDSFRLRALGELQDEQTQHFWRTTYPAYPKDAHLSLTNRLEKFLRPKVIRSLLCTPGESLNIRQAMDEGRVLLFNLSDGVLGEANAEVLGQLIVAKIQMAAMSRADTAKENRRAFTLYIDEFQSFCGVAGTSYEKILSRARKYNLSLVLAHQQTGQVPERLMREILGNVSTLISFAVGASDATRLSREFVGEFNGKAFSADPQDLQTLRVGQAVCRIDRNVFFLSTRRAPENGRAVVRDRVIARSRELYGATKVSYAEEFDLVAESPPQHSLEAIDPGDVFS